MARKTSAVANRRVSAGLFEPTDQPVESSPEKAGRAKRTFHIDLDASILLEELQTKRYRTTGAKPALSDLVSEAIRLLDQSESEHVDVKAP
jgi:hypothetical protein